MGAAGHVRAPVCPCRFHTHEPCRLPSTLETGQTYPRAIAHAPTKRELVAKQRPPGWVAPNMFQLPKVLTRGDRGGSGIEGAATACSRNSRSRSIDTLIWAALIRMSSYAQTLDGAPPVSPASVRGPFSPIWLPLPCFQKILESVLPARFYRHSKSPTAMALVGLPFASRRPNNRLG